MCTRDSMLCAFLRFTRFKKFEKCQSAAVVASELNFALSSKERLTGLIAALYLWTPKKGPTQYIGKDQKTVRSLRISDHFKRV